MRTVRDDDGTELLLLKASRDASLVQNPSTGERYYVETETLSPVSGTSPLRTASNAVSDTDGTILASVHDDRALGLLVELHERGPLAVRTVLDRYDLCERDVHGVTGELRAASLVESTTVGGEPGYELTAPASTVLDDLLEPGAPSHPD